MEAPAHEPTIPASDATPGAQPAGGGQVDDSIAIIGLPVYAQAKDIERLLAAELQDLQPVRVKVKPGVTIAKFSSEQARDRALGALQAKSVVFKRFTLTFGKAHTGQERIAQKRKAEEGGATGGKRPRTAEEAVAPLQSMTYDEQLTLKAEAICTVLSALAKRLLKANLGGVWLTRVIARAAGGRCCPQADVVRAPVTKGYRNKCEFTIGKDADGRACVGFKIGAFRDGVTAVGSPAQCDNISAQMKAAVAAMQAVVAESALPVYESTNAGKSGFWRQVLVRQNLRGELLLSIQVRRADTPCCTGDKPW